MIAMALAALLQSCVTSVAPSTMAAIISVESGGNPFEIGDNDTGLAHHPKDYASAVWLAESLLARGHNIDVGLAQVNSGNFAAYHTNARELLLPPPACENVIVGSEILTSAYNWSLATFGEQRRALWGALSAYNTGSLRRGQRYVGRVIAAAQLAPQVVVPPISILAGAEQVAPHSKKRAEPKPSPTPDNGLNYIILKPNSVHVLPK